MFKTNSRVAWINFFFSVHRRCLVLLMVKLLVLMMVTLGPPVTRLTRVRSVLQVTWLQN